MQNKGLYQQQLLMTQNIKKIDQISDSAPVYKVWFQKSGSKAFFFKTIIKQ